jgi:hypothetical protein
MPVDAHLDALRRRHRELETRLHELFNAPSADMLTIRSLKREKLKLKDEIERLTRERETGTAQRA